MYFIYADEAGTSASEPVTVVVGIILKDTMWKAVSDRISSILDEYVPDYMRSGFIFHAKEIWNGKYSRDEYNWPMEDRLQLISAMVSVPREMNLAISLGKTRRDSGESQEQGISNCDYHHLQAFGFCAARADKFVREHGEPDEVAILFAEDIPEKRTKLKNFFEKRRREDLPSVNTPGAINLTAEEIEVGEILQTDSGLIERIKDAPSFLRKEEGPILQIADACAYAFRRYFSDQEFGDFWVGAMLGGQLNADDWRGPFSESSFYKPRSRKKRSLSLMGFKIGIRRDGSKRN